MGSETTFGAASDQRDGRGRTVADPDSHSARADARDVADVVTKLTTDYGDRALTSQAIRDQHSHGEGLADAATGTPRSRSAGATSPARSAM